MVPLDYGYSDNDPRKNTCANCYYRSVAFHLVAGTSFCSLHRFRTKSSSFHTCSDWKEDSREKPFWTQDIGMAFRMPKMEEADCITTFTLDGCCPTCKNCGKVGGMYYCKKYFEELEGKERTCRMCEVGTFGTCSFYESVNDAGGKFVPPETEKALLSRGCGNVVSMDMDT